MMMEQITIHDLSQRMEENMAESELEAYSYPHIQWKLKEHFGDKKHRGADTH